MIQVELAVPGGNLGKAEGYGYRDVIQYNVLELLLANHMNEHLANTPNASSLVPVTTAYIEYMHDFAHFT